jgi:hypothetical protein
MLTTKDGSFVSEDGKVLHFSLERFVDDICLGDCCFICGVSPSDARFNREHILPQWILRRYNLHDKKIVLPNDRGHSYGRYTIPCCESCNTLLSKKLEEPICRQFDKGPDRFVDWLVNEEGSQLLFIWMATIFLKTHLKDTYLKWHADKRKGENTIAAEAYQWDIFHHLHCLVRSVYVDSIIEEKAIGSLITLPAEGEGDFDLVDLSVGQTLYLKLGRVAIYAVFDDSCASLNGLADIIDSINSPISILQGREFATRLACCNLDLVNRPTFITNVSKEQVVICGLHDEPPVFQDLSKELLGQMMYRNLSNFVAPEQRELLKSGELTFLTESSP